MRRFTVQTNRSIRKIDQQIGSLLYPENTYWRPKTRKDCAAVVRPCPYVGCKYNTYLDVRESGSIIFTNPDKEPWDIEPDKSCILDQVDDEHTLEEIGDVFNVTRERIRQIEVRILNKIKQTIDIDEEDI